jgi:alpha-mannosidase
MDTKGIKVMIVVSLALAAGPFCGLATGLDGAQTNRANAAESYFNKGNVYIVTSSHQDTAWIDTPAFCREYRVEHNIMPALEMMRKNPKYAFCMECTLHLMEFLEAHPELRGEIIKRMKEGRLEFGATYNQPYESWLSGEELIRETYFGRRWIQKNLPGCDAKVAFNPDPPGRSLQMQQILAKAGVSWMFISRYHEGLYRWQSPDGSSVLVYTPGHYGNHWGCLNDTPLSKCLSATHRKLKQQAPYYEQRHIPPDYSLVNSTDFAKPVDFTPLISAWNAQAKPRPTMGFSSIRGFFESIDKPEANFDTLLGERPDVWVYITGPTHQKTEEAKREAARLLPAAETFTTFACLLDGTFKSWPSKELDAAWMNELYIDHGIGGKNGHITDAVFQHKVESARDTGRALLDNALHKIAARVKTEPVKGIPVTIFNDLSWQRSGPVEVEVPASIAGSVRVVDADGQECPHQLTTTGEAEERNVAAGAKATASSVFSPDYGPEKAVDGRWDVRDPNDETGNSSKWNSASEPEPHWLTIDFGNPRTIHKVVLRHEGAIGAFGGETHYNTVDFQVQSAPSADGPWADLVPPIVGNTASLTVHNFAPTATRFLRIFITKGATTDSLARLYEVQAFEKVSPTPKLLFVAKDIPPLGYKTYYLACGDSTSPAQTNEISATGCENKFYRVELAPGGIKSIFDKQQNRELLDTTKFLGGEVFTMLSVAPNNRGRGTDAGEFGRVPLPVIDDSFDRVAIHKPQWKLLESGPVRTTYQLEQPLADTTVRQRLILWNQLERIDCEVDLKDFNGKLWREFHMALPLASTKPQLTYEVPMGVVGIGKNEIPTDGGFAYGGLTYTDQCRDIHPRVLQNFVDASDEQGGLTMSSSASTFDWIDPTTNGVSSPVLQPILLASRKSCNGEGVWYPQAGDHTYRFALTTHSGGWRRGRKPGVAANHPLWTVVNPQAASGATLPPEMSFASVSQDNVVISTIKKCEDDNSVVARVYDAEGKDSQVSLKLFKPFRSAEKVNLIEKEGHSLPVSNGSLTLDVGHNSIETLKLKQ